MVMRHNHPLGQYPKRGSCQELYINLCGVQRALRVIVVTDQPVGIIDKQGNEVLLHLNTRQNHVAQDFGNIT